jgi:hypothetical protein
MKNRFIRRHGYHWAQGVETWVPLGTRRRTETNEAKKTRRISNMDPIKKIHKSWKEKKTDLLAINVDA